VHASVKLTTRGPLVLVQQRLKFSNPHPAKLEGELIIPLPENASVCAFASQDENTGDMLFASVVGKEKARVAFESEVRNHGPQASLMEQIKGAGNTYKTRIYPIPANGTYTIEIHYTDSLAGTMTWEDAALANTQIDGLCSLYDDLVGLVMGWLNDCDVLSLASVNRQFWKVVCVGLVHLPLNFTGAQRLSIEMADAHLAVPLVGKTFNGIKTLPLARASAAAPSMSCDVEGTKLTGLVSSTVVSRDLLGGRASVSVDAHGDEYFFVVYDKQTPALLTSAGTQEEALPAPLPKSIGILWDTSRNRAPEAKQQDVARELKVLQAFLDALPASVVVRLSLFGVFLTPVQAHQPQTDRKWIVDAVFRSLPFSIELLCLFILLNLFKSICLSIYLST
jgi:hypothetical protein